MTEEAARIILLIKAVEEHDPKGVLLSQVQRHDASRQAALSTPQASLANPQAQETFLHERAILLQQQLAGRHPPLDRALAITRWRPGVTLALAAVALVAGVLSTSLPLNQRINILAFPLLGMIAWNVAVYVMLLVTAFRNMARPRNLALSVSGTGGLPPNPLRGPKRAGWLTRMVVGLGTRRWGRRALSESDSPSDRLQRGLEAYYAAWSEEGKSLHFLRATTALHVAAVFLVLGGIGGMYLRGLAWEYRAAWQSTFLNEHHVHRLLRIVLGPASFLTGIDLPTPAKLAQLRGPDSAGENAAAWINLYAATAGWLIVLPRSALGFLAWRAARKGSRNFRLTLENRYFVRLLRPSRGPGAETVLVGTYSFELMPSQQETLGSFLHDLAGLNARLEFLPPVPYGNEQEFIETIAARAVPADYFALLFTLAATPEQENHGWLIGRAREMVAAGRGARRLVFLLDESSYRQRLEGLGPSRIDERRKLWRRQAEACGAELLAVDLEQPEIDRWLVEIRPQLEANPAADPP